jgi:hypothetical protein
MGTQKEAAAEEMGAEQAADLARLQGLAADGAPGPETETGPDIPPVDPVESLAGFFTIGAAVFSAVGYENAAAVWRPEVCRGLAEKTVPVLVKYPWGQRAIEFLTTGAGVEEIALAMYAAPVVLATWHGAKKDMKPKAKPEAEAETETGETIDAQAVEGEPGEAMAWAA